MDASSSVYVWTECLVCTVLCKTWPKLVKELWTGTACFSSILFPPAFARHRTQVCTLVIVSVFRTTCLFASTLFKFNQNFSADERYDAAASTPSWRQRRCHANIPHQ